MMRRRARIAACVLAPFVALLVLLPGAWFGFALDDPFDKFAHLGVFFLLGLAGAIGWPERRGLFLLVLPLLGVASEAAQAFSPSRSVDWRDAAMNGIGIGAAVALSMAVTRRLERKP